MQDSEGQADHLQIFASGRRADISGFRSDIVYDGLLKPRDEEVSALVDHLFLYTRQTVEDHGSGATFNVVNRCLPEGHGKANWQCPFRDGIQDVWRSHDGEVDLVVGDGFVEEQ